VTEAAALAELKAIASKNRVLKSFIGQGYHGTHTPGVILRNILENPAWYTAYTPYQAEISQGRMEALVNFQTMVTDLTGMDIANASMLDEATAAAEAMTLAKRGQGKGARLRGVGDCHPQTIEVIQTRAAPLGLRCALPCPAEEWRPARADDLLRRLAQYPSTSGWCTTGAPDAAPSTPKAGGLHRGRRPAGPDPAQSPRRMGADIVVGTTQRFGMPMGAAARTRPTWPAATRSSAPARPPGGRERGRARQPGLPAGAADARTAHPPRKGHLQHLHRAGAARRGGQHVRGLPRPAGPEAHRPARGQLHRHLGPRPAQWATRHAAKPPSTPSRATPASRPAAADGARRGRA
jgi:hypothetical protein